MSERFEDVLRVNETFYIALESGDLELMERVWVRDSRAKCVHPGWPILLGWEAIRQSWKTIFDSGGPAKIQISNVNVEVSGDMAWITCIEHITHIVKDRVHKGLAQATNIFERHGSHWLMIHHHASPVPMTGGNMTEERLQ
ncbi:MAG TPA: nuclear transport factor 2 family protein [Thermodesulfobacteriota bacterium]|jgi:ketosteroid isomerase-like protein|nr:nuclear transport factor 2 family protein [Thermodesulfobacteriota bacterium]